MSTQLFSAGYQRSASPRDFAAHLARHGIRTVIDIRRHPRSQRPGYDATGLDEAFSHRGLAYHSVPRLGNLDALGPLWQSDPDGARRALADHFLQDEPRLLTRLIAAADEQPLCLVCVCPDWQHCHRRALLMALEESGADVVHADLSPA